MSENVKTTRPVVIHKHTSGEWKKAQNVYGEPLIVDENNEIIAKFSLRDEHKANRELCLAAPKLIQIAEMFFDYMKSKGETNSLSFQITSETLNELNQ